MATSTVEDYLKHIYLEEGREEGLVSPGRIALALRVAPGTVTAMMKTLTESGLVTYEPYAGVRLTGPGRKLAAHVLRRHRLIESFLVQVMAMDWSHVHEEAEVLEHAISERLLERIDEMLGHPGVDPHGDPIPSATGQIAEADHDNLLTCPMATPLVVARVTDQRTEFLQLLGRHRLEPGNRISVASRDTMAETVEVRPETGACVRLGFPAAGRVLVRRP